MHPFLASAAASLALAVATACSDSNALGRPHRDQRRSTRRRSARSSGTPISRGQRLHDQRGAVRTDQIGDFDFAYNIDAAPTASQLSSCRGPRLGSVQPDGEPGLQLPAPRSFDDITARAQQRLHRPIRRPDRGRRAATRSLARGDCTSLGVPLYGKLEILASRTARCTFKVLTDYNCGYRDLQPGLPDN